MAEEAGLEEERAKARLAADRLCREAPTIYMKVVLRLALSRQDPAASAVATTVANDLTRRLFRFTAALDSGRVLLARLRVVTYHGADFSCVLFWKKSASRITHVDDGMGSVPFVAMCGRIWMMKQGFPMPARALTRLLIYCVLLRGMHWNQSLNHRHC